MLLNIPMDAFPIPGDESLLYMASRFYCIVLWSITVPTYHTVEGVSFANVSGDPLGDIFVISRIVIVGPAGRTAFG